MLPDHAQTIIMCRQANMCDETDAPSTYIKDVQVRDHGVDRDQQHRRDRKHQQPADQAQVHHHTQVRDYLLLPVRQHQCDARVRVLFIGHVRQRERGGDVDHAQPDDAERARGHDRVHHGRRVPE